MSKHNYADGGALLGPCFQDHILALPSYLYQWMMMVTLQALIKNSNVLVYLVYSFTDGCTGKIGKFGHKQTI